MPKQLIQVVEMDGWEDGGKIMTALRRAKGANDVHVKARIILEAELTEALTSRDENTPWEAVTYEAVDELAERYDAEADDFVEGSRW